MAIACTLEDVKAWYERDLSRYAPWSESVEVLDDTGRTPVPSERALRFRFYTDTNCYAISAVERHGERPGYLGCIASCRKPRAGEDWTRGSDLPDGPLTEDTWRRIVANVVSYELVRVHRREEPKGVMIDVAGTEGADLPAAEMTADPGRPFN